MAGAVSDAASGAGGILSGAGTLTKLFMGVAGIGALIVAGGMLTGDVGVGITAAEASNAGSTIASTGADEVGINFGAGDVFSILGQSIQNIGQWIGGLSGGETLDIV